MISSYRNCFLFVILLTFAQWFQVSAREASSDSVLIGNFLRGAPCGIAWIMDNSAAFVLDTGGPYVAGTAAPDGSYHCYHFSHDGANIIFEWGRIGNSVVGRLSSDKQTRLKLTLSSGWPGWKSTFTGTPEGAVGVAQAPTGRVTWRLRVSPAPLSSSSSQVTIRILPDTPIRFVAGLDRRPDIASVDESLKRAKSNYNSIRPQASGDWGDFVGAIEDNMNNSRLYSNDNHRLAHSVSRTWSHTPNGSPYFCWDSFFTANLAALDDPATARNTVRAILSYQSSDGLVPNFAHWNGGASPDRSQPPVGSLCVWKMHQRYPDDKGFLNEVYPKLVLWHHWWLKYRNAKGDGLLQWGSSNRDFQDAQYETGWDDNMEYAAAAMRGSTMNCYAIDLSSMWSMDAHYLALIAQALGKTNDAARFHKEEAAMNRRINERLWNTNLGCYCSRFWNDATTSVRVAQSAFGTGFDGEYFSNEAFQHRTGSSHVEKIDFNWHGKPPIAGMASGNHWSARWKGKFTPPHTGQFRFVVSADDGVRVAVNHQVIIDDWSVHPPRVNTADVSLKRGESVPIEIDYYQQEGGSVLHFFVTQKASMHGAFLTRLTPMNFYPLSAGAPDAARATDVLRILTNPNKFWGKYLLPTLAYDDPDYHLQEYWRGDVWGPANYITWVGIKKYASPRQIDEFADRNVDLFMRNWLSHGVCSENYLSTNGKHAHDPHYTWGALLDLVGLESIVDIDDSNHIVLNGTLDKTMLLTNIPLLGRRYNVKVSPGSTELLRGGKVVLTARGTIVHSAIR